MLFRISQTAKCPATSRYSLMYMNVYIYRKIYIKLFTEMLKGHKYYIQTLAIKYSVNQDFFPTQGEEEGLKRILFICRGQPLRFDYVGMKRKIDKKTQLRML